MENLIFILFFIYIVLFFCQFLILYKLFKDENIISGLSDYLSKFNQLGFIVWKIAFGYRKISNRRNLLILRLNMILAFFVVSLIIFFIYQD